MVAIAFSGVDKHIIPGERSVRLCNYLDVYRNRRLTKEMRFSEGSATPTEIARFTLRRGDLVITKDSETPDDIEPHPVFRRLGYVSTASSAEAVWRL